MKKIVYVTTPESAKEDLHYVFECDPDATPDELYGAVIVLYPDWIAMEIVIDKR